MDKLKGFAFTIIVKGNSFFLKEMKNEYGTSGKKNKKYSALFDECTKSGCNSGKD